MVVYECELCHDTGIKADYSGYCECATPEQIALNDFELETVVVYVVTPESIN